MTMRFAALAPETLTRPTATLSQGERAGVRGLSLGSYLVVVPASSRDRRRWRSVPSAGSWSRSRSKEARRSGEALHGLGDQGQGPILVAGHQGDGILSVLPDVGGRHEGRLGVDPCRLVEHLRGRRAVRSASSASATASRCRLRRHRAEPRPV